jgi:hypothetical protein
MMDEVNSKLIKKSHSETRIRELRNELMQILFDCSEKEAEELHGYGGIAVTINCRWCGEVAVLEGDVTDTALLKAFPGAPWEEGDANEWYCSERCKDRDKGIPR